MPYFAFSKISIIVYHDQLYIKKIRNLIKRVPNVLKLGNQTLNLIYRDFEEKCLGIEPFSHFTSLYARASPVVPPKRT